MTSAYLMIGDFARVQLLMFQEKKLTSREVTRKKGSKFFVLHVQADLSNIYFILQLNQGFTFKDEKLICHSCRGITPSKVCEACGGDFAQGEKKVGYQNKTFHEKCFRCDDCKQPIGTQQFIRRDDKRLCGKCYDSGYAKVGYT